jgi:YD repeat-containing protein
MEVQMNKQYVLLFIKVFTFVIGVNTFSDCFAQDSLAIQTMKETNMNKQAQSAVSPSTGLFSEHGKVKADVNLFSGDAQIGVSLLNLAGKNGLDFSLSLSYSSNVHSLINAENQYQQASWAGLGWDLGMSSIKANLHGTAAYEDDEFFLDGVRLIKKDNYYIPENNPYKKVVMYLNDDNKIFRWEVRDENGSFYVYGSKSTSTQNVIGGCTDYRFQPHWGNWIGDGLTDVSETDFVCYQWDLSQIIDIYGNEIRFNYTHQKVFLPDINEEYTQASYLDYVIDAAGRKIDFILEDRDYTGSYLEWQDMKPDWQIEKYEKKRLDRIEVYHSVSALVPYMTIDLKYDDYVGTGNKYKILLTEIIMKDINHNALPSTKFEYYKSTDNSNTGALKKIIYPNGGEKTITYLTQDNHYLSQEPDDNTDDKSQVFIGNPNIGYEDILFSNSTNVFSYIDRDDGKFYIWRWNGKEWHRFSEDIDPTTVPFHYHLKVSDKHVAYYLYGTSNNLKLYTWDDKKKVWEVTFSTTLTNIYAINVTESMFGYAHWDGTNVTLYFKYWNNQQREWIDAGSILTNDAYDVMTLDLSIVNNLALLHESVDRNSTTGDQTSCKMFLCKWDGETSWSEMLSEDHNQSNLKNFRYYLTENSMVMYCEYTYFSDPVANLQLYHFDGNSIVNDYISMDEEFVGFRYSWNEESSNALYSYPVVSNKHIAFCEYHAWNGGNYGGPDHIKVHMWNKTSNGWIKDPIIYRPVEVIYNDGPFYTVCLNDNFFIILQWNKQTSDQGPIYCYQWNEENDIWEECGINGIIPDSDNLSGAFYFETPETGPRVFPQIQLVGDRVILHYGNSSAGGTISWKWNGSQWLGPETIFQDNGTYETPMASYGIYKLFTSPNFIGKYRSRKGEVNVKFVHGIEEYDNTVTDYPVFQISENDGYNSNALVTEYSFPSDLGYMTYDPAINIAGYNSAEEILQGAYGYTKHTFNNEIVQGNNAENAKRGYPDQIITYNENSNIAARQDKSWNVYTENCAGNTYAHQVRLSSETRMLDNVDNITNYIYNNSNGQIYETQEINNDNTQRITRTVYAFEKYSDMLFYNMLTQAAQKTVYRKVGTNLSARSSNVTTWGDWGQYWAPVSSYQWLDMNSDYICADFESTNWINDTTPDAEWQKVLKIFKRDNSGNVLASEDARGTVTSALWGYNQTLPVAEVKNAKFKETDYLGFENQEISTGWNIGQGIMSDNIARTGEYSFLALNNEDGLVKCWQSEGNNHDFEYELYGVYVASVWVYVTNSNGIGQNIFGVKQYPYPYPPATQSAQATKVNEWELLTIWFDTSLILGYEDMCVWASAIDAGCNVYFDDLRVYPEDALMTSQTYDEKTYQITGQSNENNIPLISEYDGFGRLLRKINADRDWVAFYQYYFSRNGTGIFDPVNPNYVHEVITQSDFAGDEIHTFRFSDGLGRVIQTQTIEGVDDIVTRQTFNSIGKVWKEYKPQKIYNPLHTFISSISGPFVETTYYPDPLARAYQILHPNNSGIITYDYGSDNINISVYNGSYRYKSMTNRVDPSDPNQDQTTTTYIDNLGNEIVTLTGDNNKQTTSSKQYDIHGNVTFTEPPNFHNPVRGVSSDWDTEIKYNTLGQVIEKTTPDEGTFKYVYDANGNLKYSQNEEQRPDGDFIVYYYDTHNRVIYIGEEKDYDWNAVPPDVNNTSYGKSISELRIFKVYDIDCTESSENYCRGRLSKARVIDHQDYTNDHIIKYIYDKYGNKIQENIEYDNKYSGLDNIITYEYDLLGRQILMTYPSGHEITKSYDRVGRFNEVSTLTNPPPAVAPESPGSLTANSVSANQIQLTWQDNSINEHGFKIERKTGTEQFSVVAVVDADVIDYTDINLSANTTYTYRIRAYNQVDNSDYSNTASATTTLGDVPSAPTGLDLTIVSSNQIDLSWTDNSDNENGFIIERREGLGSYLHIATTGANAINYSNTGLSPNTVYTYRVYAYGTYYNSGYSNEKSGITPSDESSTEESIWGNLTTEISYGNGTPWELGTVFQSSVSGQINAIRVYSCANESGNHTARIWRNSDNTVISGPHTINYGGTAGWITYNLVTPITIEAFTDYTVVVTNGTDTQKEFPYIEGLTANPGNNGDHLSYPDSGGVCTKTMGTRPTGSFSNCYLRDIVFIAHGPGGDPPSAPGSLNGSAESTTEINLTWTDNSDNETGFKMERSSDGGSNFTTISTMGSDVTSYNDTGLSPSTTYTYRLLAYNNYGNSGYSNEADITTQSGGTAPSGPTGLGGTAVSSSQINLTWSDNSGNEDGFKVERSSNGGSTFTEIASVGVNVTGYNDTGLSSSTTYTYRVFAYNTYGNSNYSNQINKTTQSDGGGTEETIWGSLPPGTSYGNGNQWELGTVFQSSVSGDIIAIRVHSCTGESGNHTAHIWRNSDNTVISGPHIYNYGGTSEWLTFSLASPVSIEANTDYTVVVTTGTDSQKEFPYINGGTSNAGNNGDHLSYPAGGGVCTQSLGTRPTFSYNNNYLRDIVFLPGGVGEDPPAAPGSLNGSAVSGTEINLTWSDNSNNETGFKVERSTDSGSTFTEIAALSANVTSYNNTGLSPSTTYTYRVYAYNIYGNSGYSNEADVTTFPPGSPPSAPTGLGGTAVSSSQIDLTWTDNSGDEDGFKVERSTDSGSTFSEITSISANVTSYSNTGLTASTTYTYRVYAYNNYGNSGYSNEVNVTTQSGGGGTEETIWGDIPPGTSYGNGNQWELGTVFQSSVSGDIIAIRVHSCTDESGNHTARIWRNSDDTVISGPHTFNYGGTSEWFTFNLAVPVSIEANTDYTVVVTTGTDSQKEFPYINGGTTNAGNNGNHLSYPAGGGVGTQSLGTRPTTTFNNNYLRDIVFLPGGVSEDPPAAPGSLNGSAVSSTEINLTWTDNSNNETGFKVERSTDSGSTFTEIASPGANVTSYNNTGLSPSTTYTYRVYAYNSYGKSGYSNEADVTTSPPGSPPSAPTGLGGTAVSSSQIDLTWSDNSSNEDGFKVERSTDSGSTFSEITSLGANVTSYSNTGLTASTIYTYRVYAHNTYGNSGYSNQVDVTTQSGGGDLIAHWKFDNSGVDVSGNSHTATLYNGAFYSTDSHVGTHSVSLYENSDYVDVGSIDLGNTFTIALWAKMPSGSSNIKTIIANASSGSNTDGFKLFVNLYQTSDQKIFFENANGTSHNNAYAPDGTFAFGQWNHVAVVVNRTAGTALIYCNGTDVTFKSDIMTDFKVNGVIHLGEMIGGGYDMNGFLDDVRIYSRCLSASEIADLAN